MHHEAEFYGGKAQDNIHEVWEENTPAWDCFVSLSDQWLFAPMGGAIGLNGAVVMDYLRMVGIEQGLQRQIYDDIRHIASGALKAWREKSDTKG